MMWQLFAFQEKLRKQLCDNVAEEVAESMQQFIRLWQAEDEAQDRLRHVAEVITESRALSSASPGSGALSTAFRIAP